VPIIINGVSGGGGGDSSYPLIAVLHFYLEALQVFRRYYDIADYPIGWVFNIPWTKPGSIFTIVHYKSSKVMEAPKYVTVISIFGREYVK
jgi:hypothetical protein